MPTAMKLTAFTDFSLRVLLYLAADPGRRATIAEIADAFGVSANHLVKVVHSLGKQGWIETVRGKGGGIRLAMPARQVNIGKVVRDTEGAAMPAECFDTNGGDNGGKNGQENGGGCVIDGCCRLKGVFAEAVKAFYAALDRHTLEDIARNRRKLVSVLEIAARNDRAEVAGGQA